MLLVEDHTLLRQAFAKLLADEKMIEVVGEAGNGFDAVAKARELQPDVILMDLYMPGMDGVAATRLIKREQPDAQVILLTISTEEDDILKAMQAGARGYISKNADATALVQQVKHVVSGGVALSEDMIGRLLKGLTGNGHGCVNSDWSMQQPLTPREKEVLALVSQGMGNKEISSALDISQNTVRSYVRSLMQKLNLDNRTQLAVYGIREGFGPTVGNHNGNGRH